MLDECPECANFGYDGDGCPLCGAVAGGFKRADEIESQIKDLDSAAQKRREELGVTDDELRDFLTRFSSALSDIAREGQL